MEYIHQTIAIGVFPLEYKMCLYDRYTVKSFTDVMFSRSMKKCTNGFTLYILIACHIQLVHREIIIP